MDTATAAPATRQHPTRTPPAGAQPTEDDVVLVSPVDALIAKWAKAAAVILIGGGGGWALILWALWALLDR